MVLGKEYGVADALAPHLKRFLRALRVSRINYCCGKRGSGHGVGRFRRRVTRVGDVASLP